jgi:hypothetical protein
MFDEQWTGVKRFLGHRSAICLKHGYGSVGKMQATIVTYGEVRSWSGFIRIEAIPHGWACIEYGGAFLVKIHSS